MKINLAKLATAPTLIRYLVIERSPMIDKWRSRIDELTLGLSKALTVTEREKFKFLIEDSKHQCALLYKDISEYEDKSALFGYNRP